MLYLIKHYINTLTGLKVTHRTRRGKKSLSMVLRYSAAAPPFQGHRRCTTHLRMRDC